MSTLLEVADKVELVLIGTAGGFLGFLTLVLEKICSFPPLCSTFLTLALTPEKMCSFPPLFSTAVSLGFNSAVVETEELVEDREDVDDPPPPPVEMESTSYSANYRAHSVLRGF